MPSADLPHRDQGRARGLYDEQLQRQQQEKMLFRRTRDARLSFTEMLDITARA